MMGKRQLLGTVMRGLGVLSLLELARKAYRNCRQLTVLTYHRVLDIEPENYPFDDQVVSATVWDFETQVAFLSRAYQAITFERLRRFYYEGAPLPPAPLILAFDDGYSDVYTNAFPILKRYNLPATVFVVTDHVGTTRPFWFEKVVYLIKHTRKNHVTLPVAGLDRIAMPEANRRQAYRSVITRLKEVPDDIRLESLEQLEDQLEVEIRDEDLHMVRPLSWDEVREMHHWGVEIGSHTASHPILPRVHPEKLETELLISRTKIEEEIGTKAHVLAYPVGRHNEKVKAALARAGYAFGIGTASGPNDLGRLDPYCIKRMGVDLSLNFSLFRCQLAFPRLFGCPGGNIHTDG